MTGDFDAGASIAGAVACIAGVLAAGALLFTAVLLFCGLSFLAGLVFLSAAVATLVSKKENVCCVANLAPAAVWG